MKLSTRVQYGTRALLDLALHAGGATVPLKRIAERQEISLQYLEHLVAPLISAGIINSVRGPRGGIKLVRRPEEIKLSELYDLLEGNQVPVDCLRDSSACSRYDFCVTRDVWAEIDSAVQNVLGGTTLADLVAKHKIRAGGEAINYSI